MKDVSQHIGDLMFKMVCTTENNRPVRQFMVKLWQSKTIRYEIMYQEGWGDTGDRTYI